MTKFLNKWLRKTHRWLVWPFIVLLVLILFNRDTTLGQTFQRVQAPLMIVMALTGGYLWLAPYLSKWQRGRRRSEQKHSVGREAKSAPALPPKRNPSP